MTTSSTAAPHAPSELLVESAEWRLLGLLFACPRCDWHAQVTSLADEVSDDLLERAARAALDEAQECVYHTAFGPGGPAPAREVTHRQTALSGQYLSELLAFYKAFAYRSSRDEPPDHIAVEIDFVAYLRLKQSYAVARNDEPQVAITAQAVERFIQDHLALFGDPLARVLEHSGIQYLRLAMAALSERLGPYRTQTVSASLKSDQAGDLALPIYDPDDCCVEPFE